jgi:Fe(3+) dicitrate transport protein
MDPRFRILYKISDDYNIFTSVQRVFASGIKTGEDAENSLNTELGFRFDKGALHGEVIGYYNNFSNLQGSDSMSGGGAGTGDLMLVQPL